MIEEVNNMISQYLKKGWDLLQSELKYVFHQTDS